MHRILILTLYLATMGCGDSTPKQTSKPGDKTPDNPYVSTTVELKIDDQTSLMIVLQKDGTIKRSGDGTEEIDDRLFTGVQHDSLLYKLTSTISPDFESQLNKVYDYPDKKGRTCMLEITLTDGNGRKGVRYIYGMASSGPPIPIVNYLLKALELTNPWYDAQVRAAGN